MKYVFLNSLFILISFSSVALFAQTETNKPAQSVDIEKLLGGIERNNLLLSAMKVDREIEGLKKTHPHSVSEQYRLEGFVTSAAPELSEFATDISRAKIDPIMAERYVAGLNKRFKKAQDRELLRTFIEDDPRFIAIGEDVNNMTPAQRSALEKAFLRNGGYTISTGTSLEEKLQATLFNPDLEDPLGLENTSEVIYSSLRDRYKIHALSELDYSDIGMNGMVNDILERNGKNGLPFVKTKGMLVLQMHISGEVYREVAIEQAKKITEQLVLQLASEGIEAQIEMQRRDQEQQFADSAIYRGLPAKKIFMSSNTLIQKPVNIWIKFRFLRKFPDKVWQDKEQAVDKNALATKFETIFKQLMATSKAAAKLKQEKDKTNYKAMSCKSLF